MDLSLEKLDIANSAELLNWHERFDLYCLTNSKITKENKTAYYLTLAGKEAYTLLKDLAYPKEIKDMSVNDLRDLLKSHLQIDSNVIMQRAQFHSATRAKEETYREFLLRLQRMAAKCNFKTELETQLRDRIVAGISDHELQKRLLKEGDSLTYAAAKKILEESDLVNRAASAPTEVFFGAKQRFKPKPKTNRQHSQAKPTFKQHPKETTAAIASSTCHSCGGKHLRKDCRFRNSQCYKCNRNGHIAKVCRANQSIAKPKFVNGTSFEDSDNDDIKVLTSTTSMKGSHIYKSIAFKTNKHLDFIVDTGSPITFMPILAQNRCIIGRNSS